MTSAQAQSRRIEERALRIQVVSGRSSSPKIECYLVLGHTLHACVGARRWRWRHLLWIALRRNPAGTELLSATAPQTHSSAERSPGAVSSPLLLGVSFEQLPVVGIILLEKRFCLQQLHTALSWPAL